MYIKRQRDKFLYIIVAIGEQINRMTSQVDNPRKITHHTPIRFQKIEVTKCSITLAELSVEGITVQVLRANKYFDYFDYLFIY